MYNFRRLSSFSTILCTCTQNHYRDLSRLHAKRHASNFKRTTVLKLPPDQMQELQTNLFQNGKEIRDDEWQHTRNSLISNHKYINESNVDAAILGLCNEGSQLDAAKSYVKYLANQKQGTNIATLGRLLRVYYLKYQSSGADSLSAEEQGEVLTLYKHIRGQHDILDATTCENLIHGIVATDKWHDGLELLEMIKLSAIPSISTYNVLIVKAFRVGDMRTGWAILSQMLQEQRQPKCDIFITYLKTIAKSEINFVENFELILEFIGRHELIITTAVCQEISQLAVQKPHLLQVAPTQLNQFGKCNVCGTHMQNVSISDEEFKQLSDSFLNKVLIRNDVFQKSTPEEVELFKNYIIDTGPYDCVVDGLNVAYSRGTRKSPSVYANLLAAVVKYFQNKNKHILILGRKHMSNWPKDSMNYIRKNARVFLANDLSQDDPFLLYATIKSGQSTDFFSRDLMRSHAFLLGPELKPIFKRWQQEHQYSLVTQTKSGKIIVKEPIRHIIHAHKVNSTWHIPTKLEYSPNPVEYYETPENWLCINFQKKDF